MYLEQPQANLFECYLYISSAVYMLMYYLLLIIATKDYVVCQLMYIPYYHHQIIDELHYEPLF